MELKLAILVREVLQQVSAHVRQQAGVRDRAVPPDLLERVHLRG